MILKMKEKFSVCPYCTMDSYDSWFFPLPIVLFNKKPAYPVNYNKTMKVFILWKINNKKSK